MSELIDIRSVDKDFYKKRLEAFLPKKIIDIHTHVWLDKFKAQKASSPLRTVTWTSLVAKDNSIEDLINTYRLLFPSKEVTPLIFSNISPEDDIEEANNYICQCSKRYNFPALVFATPKWSAQTLEEKIKENGFYGCKVYLNFAEPYIPTNEIRIFDFLPHHQLEILNRHGLIVILHIPRDARLKDPVNLAQMMEIDRRYPNIKTIIAHVGRAYCNEDVGDAFEILKESKNLLFDFSANTNQWVFEQLINAVGPKRILFGSDLPILRMRTHRICEDGRYINLVAKGMYGDVSKDKNMREIEGAEAEKLTFFLYEEIDAFRRAAENTGLSTMDIEDIFYNNAYRMLKDVKRRFL